MWTTLAAPLTSLLVLMYVLTQTGLVIQTLQLESRSQRADRSFGYGSGVGSNSVSPTKEVCQKPVSCDLTEESSCVSYLDEEGSYNEDAV